MDNHSNLIALSIVAHRMGISIEALQARIRRGVFPLEIISLSRSGRDRRVRADDLERLLTGQLDMQ